MAGILLLILFEILGVGISLLVLKNEFLHKCIGNTIIANSILSVVILLGTISGSLSIDREAVSSYVLFGRETVECSEFVKSSTLADELSGQAV